MMYSLDKVGLLREIDESVWEILGFKRLKTEISQTKNSIKKMIISYHPLKKTTQPQQFLLVGLRSEADGYVWEILGFK